MPRRSHTKSRNGCSECKKRHVKCDETSPRCINCVTAQIKCSFEKSSRPSNDYQPAQSRPQTATQPPTPNSHRTLSPHPVHAVPVTTAEPDLNFQHLELLHQFCIKTAATFSPEPAQQELWRTLAVRYGLMHPFLMYQMLAVSALHLGYENPSRVDYYSETATVLQNAAMTRFHALERGINESNCASVLLFSSLLALHVLADPTRTRGLDLPGHVDHLISCIKLMKSVRRLVIHDWWDYLSSHPDLKPLLVIDTPSKPYNIPQDVRDLDELPKGSDLSEKATAAYKDAIEHLHWLYAASEVPQRTYTTGRWILAWPVQLSHGYLDLLDERRPEAMIILCYYAALLYYYRGCWIVGDMGVYLIKAICAHLGGYWEKWLRWPKELVAHVPTP